MNQEYLGYCKNEIQELVINYKPLNKLLKWFTYPLPNKNYLIKTTHNAAIFSNFDMKSGYYQIEAEEKDRYKLPLLYHLDIMNGA